MICRQLFGRSQYSMLMIRVIRDAKVSPFNRSFVQTWSLLGCAFHSLLVRLWLKLSLMWHSPNPLSVDPIGMRNADNWLLESDVCPQNTIFPTGADQLAVPLELSVLFNDLVHWSANFKVCPSSEV